ncbi:TetR/AcrR family transcriptional regulator [Sporosarcina limicola]|uniref:AcrR family transcriptional regulator n=1 Tax=Sporosarcina limicola TaxID=34101 RepID=A0A927R7A6_9BACL|nr:TetR/AcrR family transcriptional regulator [Sporosarcina limicola]MBE1555794.1 AcrR family transcriptional regulator [Sporosarcina limicola]
MNERKRQVLLTAQRLFIEKGFSTTSIQDILDESQISKGTFYNYFTSKNECLIAILERAHEEATIRRRELLIEQDFTDKNILAEQISIRMLVNREHNLLPIYEAVFYSGDADLRKFIRKHHLAELSWLTDRLIDVYGKKATPYAPDCAVILVGMIQHFIHFCMASSKKEFDTRSLVLFAMRRIDSIIFDMMEQNDTLLRGLAFNSNHKGDDKKELKELSITQLTDFLCHLEDNSKSNGVQYAKFLLDEIHSEHPRVFILETVARSFRETFSGTRHEAEALEVASNLWGYINLLEKDGHLI